MTSPPRGDPSPERRTKRRPRHAVGVLDRALRDEVLRGLQDHPKHLPPKLFYDEIGARLFEEITELDEYYPTRCELEILHAASTRIAVLAGQRCALIEYGSGAGIKVRLLLDALADPVAYVPIDISAEQLEEVAAELKQEYPQMDIRPVAADYTRDITLPELPAHARRLAFFPGSTIGNFHPDEAAGFLRRIAATVGQGGGLVIGVDRRKDRATLEAAYNDARGVTAAFNMNMLARLNRELGANFDLDAFEHRAWFNETASRIEMHLVSTRHQVVDVAGARITFDRDETIWTESSYKYTTEGFTALVKSAGFVVREVWSDDSDRFMVAFLEAGSR